ncbi:MFS transporter [Novosphingobium bradum]|uniref:MFS transporter n=1 Tax=Novosphingobium bradum TaxID=1737444 RepID=A0ABV7IN68_9SPHN
MAAGSHVPGETQMMTEAQGRNAIYPGWKVLGAAFACSMLTLGATFSSFGLFILPLSKELGLSRAEMSSGMMALLIGLAVWSPLAGYLVDRIRARRVVMGGGLLLMTGAAVIATVPSGLAALGAAFFLIAFGIACAGPLTGSALVTRWFQRRRGRALGILAVSTSTGGVVIPPLLAMLIIHLGARSTLLLLGCAVGVAIMVLAMAFLTDRPTRQQLADADEALDAEAVGFGHGAEASSPAGGESLWACVATSRFWLILLCTGTLIALEQTLLTLNVPIFMGHGITLQSASFMVACQSGAATVGKLTVGFLLERFDPRRMFSVVAGLHALFVLFYIFWPGHAVMFVALGVLGLAIGAAMPIQLTLIAAAFPDRTFGRVYGTIGFGTQVISIAFLGLAGRAFEVLGRYDQAFWLFGFLAMASALLIFMLGRKGGAGHEVRPAAA